LRTRSHRGDDLVPAEPSKGKRRCGVCNVVGHNARTCPEKQK
jgi:hypothetical protein